MQGTCLEQQGQTGGATDAYKESIKQLKKSPDNTEEVFTPIMPIDWQQIPKALLVTQASSAVLKCNV